MITLEWLADMGLRAAAVVVLAGLFVRTVSRDPAALRHLAWTLALGSVLVVPVLSQVLPWRLPVLPSATSSAFDRARTDEDGRGQARTVEQAAVPGSQKLAPSSEAASGNEKTVLDLSRPSSPTLVQPARVRLETLGPLLWAGIAGLLLLRLAVGFVLLGRVTRSARELASAEWLGLLDRACRRLDVRVVPRLLVSDRVSMPCTAGWRRPVILLPRGAESWDRERREVVLMHELAHVKRRDFVPHLLAQAACAFQWFNPLVWIAAHRMRSDAERACDDLVLDAGARASDYAAHLLEIVRGSGPGRAPAPALPMAQRSEFEGRLLAILESSGERRLPSLRAGLVTAGFLMIAVLPVAAIGAAAPAPDSVEEFRQPDLSPMGEPDGQDADPDGAAAPEVRVAGQNLPKPEAGSEAPVQARSERQESARVLIETLGDTNAEVRAAAVEALGALDDTLAVRALMEVLRRDADAGVRRNAAWALGELEDARAVPALSEALQSDADVEVRRNAAWALGSIEDPRGTPALVAALRRERESSIRKAIIEALGSIEDMSSTEAILPALKDQDPEIRRAAADALSSLEDPKSVDELMAAARDSDAEVRRAVIDALGSIEDRRAAPVIARALSDSDVEVRRAAANAIGSLDELRQVPRELIAALSDADAEVREHAISSLSNFEDPASVGPLTALLKDENVEIRRAAVEALENIDDPGATRALREALKDTDPEVRRIAAKALGHRKR